MDVKLYLRNRANFSLDELEKYRGKYVAFSPDGTFIVAAHKDLKKLCELVAASEHNPEECVISGEVLFDDCETYLGEFLAES